MPADWKVEATVVEDSSSCDTDDDNCCDTIDTNSDCPEPWEYVDPCSCITDSSDPEYDSTDDEGCEPCLCYNPAYPRSDNWNYKPTDYRLHFNRKATGNSIQTAMYIESLKVIWMELGFWKCISDIGTGTYMPDPASPLNFQDYGSWTNFD